MLDMRDTDSLGSRSDNLDSARDTARVNMRDSARETPRDNSNIFIRLKPFLSHNFFGILNTTRDAPIDLDFLT